MRTHVTNKKLLLPGGVRGVIILLLVIGVLALGVVGMFLLKESGPKADKEAPPKAVPRVKVTIAQKIDRQVYVRTQGEVKDRMSTQLSSQVVGRTTMVSPKLKTGGVFEKGEVMLEIERANYVSVLARSESSLADAKLALKQEMARAEQALRDWRKLGKGQAPDLVARKPQLASAKAKVTAAEAEVVKATGDLVSTSLVAPYHCRIDQSYVNYGAHIVSGMRVVDISSIDARELRVPIPLSELAYLDRENLIGSHVDVSANFAGASKTWTGKLVRNEGKVDRNTRTMYLAVEIAASSKQPLTELPPAGLFVDAAIKGRVISQVVEIPRRALSSNNTVMIVDTEGALQILDVEIAKTTKDTVLISKGIPTGSKVITSAIETPVVGMQVDIEPTPNDKN